MDFNLDRDLVFFDVEATGLNVIRDRIIQIAGIRYFKDGRPPRELEMLINPGIPIGWEALQVHGIRPEDLADKPTFAQVADELWAFFDDADLAGYNCARYDVPMLMEEFARAGYDFDLDNRRIIDVQRIFYRMEPRTLRAALKFYCGKEMENAHDALADVRATIEVFKGQLERYKDVDHVDADGNVTPRPVRNDMQALHDFTQDPRTVDVTNRLKYNEKGEIVFNFGKYIGKPVAETLHKDKQYYNWILSKDFSVQVKRTVKKLVREYEQQLKTQKDQSG